MEVLILKIVIGLRFGQFGSVDCRWLTDEGSRGKVKTHRPERSFLCLWVAAERSFSRATARRSTERFVDMEVSRMKDLRCKGSLAEGEAHYFTWRLQQSRDGVVNSPLR